MPSPTSCGDRQFIVLPEEGGFVRVPPGGESLPRAAMFMFKRVLAEWGEERAAEIVAEP